MFAIFPSDNSESYTELHIHLNPYKFGFFSYFSFIFPKV